LKEYERANFSNLQKKTQKLDQLYEELSKKRCTKYFTRKSRKNNNTSLLPHTPIEVIPIQIVDSHKYLHYLLSPEDIRNVIKRLPPPLTDGLDSIHLELGKEIQEELDEENFGMEPEPDPFLGRKGYEIIPGIYMSRCRGVYEPWTNRIRIFGYVYDQIPHQQVIELHLRLQMLSVLAHELAHHQDCFRRFKHGKWAYSQTAKGENYADINEYTIFHRYIIPYIEETYPRQIEELNRWIKHYGGIPLPLCMFADDRRDTIKGNKIKLIALFGNVFENLITDVLDGLDLTYTHIRLANHLHYLEQYDLSLKILDKILKQDRHNLDALTLKADIFVHLKLYDKAFAVAKSAISIEKKCGAALVIIAYIYLQQKQWPPLLKITNRLVKLYEGQNRIRHTKAIALRARAKYHSKDFDGFRDDIEILKSAGQMGKLEVKYIEKDLKIRVK